MFKSAEYHRGMLIMSRLWGYLTTALIAFFIGTAIAAWIIWPPGIFAGLSEYSFGYILSFLPVPDYTGAVAFYIQRSAMLTSAGLWPILHPPMLWGAYAVFVALIIRFLVIGFLACRNGGRAETGESIVLR